MSNIISERWLHDPVPKNVTKFPINQTYLTTDAERNSNGGYKFKCPEVWSSARSAKKAIAIKSIEWASATVFLNFNIKFHLKEGDNPDSEDHSDDFSVEISTPIINNLSMIDILNQLKLVINKELEKEDAPPIVFYYEYKEDKVNLSVLDTTLTNTYQIYIEKVDIKRDPVTNAVIYNSFDRIFNQPYSGDINWSDKKIELKNVWDRSSVNFHASFIPFDNYQYLGELGDFFNNPLVYQDPNSSPLFNIWTTLDFKTPYVILHEPFCFRFIFIISVAENYQD